MKALPLLLLAATTSAALAQAPDLSGAWRFVDDGTVIEFVACGAAQCGRVRALPPPEPKSDEPPPRCGQDVVLGLRADGRRWQGEVLDPASGKRYRAQVQPAKTAGELELVVSALGGLVTETMRLQPARDFKACGV
jgi:uncharacterized protein (DUF2147 family)